MIGEKGYKIGLITLMTLFSGIWIVNLIIVEKEPFSLIGFLACLVLVCLMCTGALLSVIRLYKAGCGISFLKNAAVPATICFVLQVLLLLLGDSIKKAAYTYHNEFWGALEFIVKYLDSGALFCGFTISVLVLLISFPHVIRMKK